MRLLWVLHHSLAWASKLHPDSSKFGLSFRFLRVQLQALPLKEKLLTWKERQNCRVGALPISWSPFLFKVTVVGRRVPLVLPTETYISVLYSVTFSWIHNWKRMNSNSIHGPNVVIQPVLCYKYWALFYENERFSCHVLSSAKMYILEAQFFHNPPGTQLDAGIMAWDPNSVLFTPYELRYMHGITYSLRKAHGEFCRALLPSRHSISSTFLKFSNGHCCYFLLLSLIWGNKTGIFSHPTHPPHHSQSNSSRK